MAGFVPNEGEQVMGELVGKRLLTDRDADLELGVFTDAAPGETITLATISEPTGGSYARIALPDSECTVTNGVASWPEKTFTAVGSAYSAPVVGYFIATKAAGGTPRLLAVEIDAAGPHTMNENDTYDVTPQLDFTVEPA